MIATYFIFRGTKSAKRAENPCPPRKYLASTAIYRLYTFCCQFARAFFRISDKKFFRFKSSSPPLPPSVFSTAEMKLFHEKLSQLHKLQEWGEKGNRIRAAASPSQSSLRDASSPKVGALGSPRKLHLFAKASPFGRGGCERSEQTERASTLKHKQLRQKHSLCKRSRCTWFRAAAPFL